MCNKVVAAVRALDESKAYEGKIEFTVVPSSQTGFKEEVQSFDIGSHGLVAFDAKGSPVTKIAGHNFGKDEIVQAIQALLDS